VQTEFTATAAASPRQKNVTIIIVVCGDLETAACVNALMVLSSINKY